MTSVLEGVRSAFEALNDVNDLSEVSVVIAAVPFRLRGCAEPGQYDLTVSQLAAGEAGPLGLRRRLGLC